MSFNPTRAGNYWQGIQKKQFVPGPKDGVSHSDIMKKMGFNTMQPMQGLRKEIKYGYAVSIFEGEDFVVRYEVMFAGNSTGLGFSKNGDRTIHILRGQLYVMDEAGNSKQLFTGAQFSVKRGDVYGYSTSGVDSAELLVIESKDYEKSWKQKQPAVTSDKNPVFETEAVRLAREGKTEPRAKRDNSKSIAQAQAMAQERATRVPMAGDNTVAKARATNPNSSASIGVNPRPDPIPSE